MNWFLRILFVLATWALATTKLHAQESPYSLNVFGFSWHEDSSQRTDAHQVNPGIGLRYDLNDHCYTEGNIIFKNSVKGKTSTVGLGCHIEIARLNNRPLKIGVQVMHMRYEFPSKQDQSGYVPALTFEYPIFKNTKLTAYTFIKPKKSVVFGGLNYRF